VNIAILDQSCAGWSAGASFTRMMLACLSLARANHEGEIFFLSGRTDLEIGPEFRRLDLPKDIDAAGFAEILRTHEIEATIPVRDHLVHEIPGAKVGWVPDFQHFRLPELFTEENIAERDELLAAVVYGCDVVLVSSESAREDLAAFAPEAVAKARVGRFSSMLWQSTFREYVDVRSKYHLPERFFLVANQFWKHKDHAVLPGALAEAHEAGARPFVVCTGLTCDYRDPENRVFSEFLRSCSELGVRDRIAILGQVPYGDLVSLMRTAQAVLQPSRFEGWSTSVEDCKALGRPLICSDIPVHREQAGDDGIFFPLSDASRLGQVLASESEKLGAGPDPEREQTALSDAKTRAKEYGEALLAMAREAADRYVTHSATPTNPPISKRAVPLVRQQADYIAELEKACSERLQGMEALRAEVERLRGELAAIDASPLRMAVKKFLGRR
jgi:glycosyltransferase involved in cell wall biosynthesis